MRKFFYLVIAAGFCQGVMAQSSPTLFTYGANKVSKDEFYRAWARNNPSVAPADRATSLKAYLDLYVNYKLKVRAARDAGLDKNQQQSADASAFEKQLSEQSMNRLEGMVALRNEALGRAQTDVELAQVFVGYTGNDTTAAYAKVNGALEQLKKGIPFETVAATYSTDAEVQQAKGYIGYVTAFILPYAVENTVYALAPGQYSGVYRSGSGYHIFKCISRRADPGTFRGAQILLAYPPKADPATRQAVAAQAQKVHDLLVQGVSFDSLVLQYSNDKMTYGTHGELPDFTVGRFDPVFERAAFALQKDGDISDVVTTANGYHIIKRLSLTPPVKDSGETRQWYELQQHVLYSDRMEAAKMAFAHKILPAIGYRVQPVDTAWLFRTADSVIHHPDVETFLRNMAPKTLFKFKSQAYTTHDWFHYLYYKKRYQIAQQVKVDYKALLNDYTLVSALLYYQEHLAEYDNDYRQQVQDYKDGNLFFEAMQRNVWNKAGEDSVALVKLYRSQPDKYQWGPCFDAIIVNGTDSVALDAARLQLQKAPAGWRATMAEFKTATADSVRLDQSVLPAGLPVQTGATAVLHQADGSNTFYYILQVHNQPIPRTFEEAKGLLVNDYQTVLEQQWIAALRKKYPVKINWQMLQ